MGLQIGLRTMHFRPEIRSGSVITCGAEKTKEKAIYLDNISVEEKLVNNVSAGNTNGQTNDAKWH